MIVNYFSTSINPNTKSKICTFEVTDDSFNFDSCNQIVVPKGFVVGNGLISSFLSESEDKTYALIYSHTTDV